MIGHIADDVLPGLGPHHHPPEHPVPLRRRSSGSPTVMRDLAVGRPHHPRGVRRHRPQRAGLPPRRRLPVRGARHHARGPRPPSSTSSATRSPSACPASSRSTSRAAPPTAARRCSTTSASSPSRRTDDDGTVEPGFRVFVAGGLGANPHPALALEEFTPREELLPTIEAVLRVFDQPRQPRQQAAGPPEVAGRHAWAGTRSSARILKERKLPRRPRRRGPAASPRSCRSTATSRPACAVGVAPTPMGQGIAGRHPAAATPYERWEQANVVRGAAKGTVSAYAWARLGDITSDQFRALAVDPARARRRGAGHQPPELRVPRPHRGAAAARCTTGSTPSAWPSPAPSWPATSSPARAPTPATSPSPSPAAWPTPSASALEEEGLAEVGGVRTNISGCTNSCGQHHIVRHRVLRRRAPGPRRSPPPATRCCSAATSARSRSTSARRRCACRPRTRREAAVRVVRRFADEREAGESFRVWMDRSGGAKAHRRRPRATSTSSPTPDERPDFYVDYGETGPVRGRDRRLGVRDMSRADLDDARARATPTVVSTSPTRSSPSSTPSSSSLPASKIIQWAVDSFAPHLSPDGVDDRRRAHRPRRRRSTRPSRSSSSTPATTSPRRSRPSRRCGAATG